MVKRTQYLEKLRKMQGSQIIKVITGVRCYGKSSLLAQFQEELLANVVDSEQRIGKVGEMEIDFVATIGSDIRYYPVTVSVLDPATFARGIAPLKAMKDNYPKTILSLDELPM